MLQVMPVILIFFQAEVSFWITNCHASFFKIPGLQEKCGGLVLSTVHVVFWIVISII